MAAIDLKGLTTTFKSQGARTALIALATTLALGVVDQFTARIIPQATAAIDNFLDPPNFVMRFSQPVEIEANGIELRDSGADPEGAAPVAYRVEAPRLVVVAAPPGSYIVLLRRNMGGDRQLLVEAVLVKDKGQSVSVDTSDGNWVSSAALEQAGDQGGEPAQPDAPPSFLSGTRWTTTADDFAAIPTLPDRNARSVLAIALAEVGTHEFGSEPERARIREYWATVPGWAGPTDTLAWGATFISWVIDRARLAPPDGAAAYASWRNWGVLVSPELVTPGMVAIFARPGGGSQPRYTAGIIVRQRETCTEIVAGNLGDRVAVTCVSEKPLEVRWRPQALDETEVGAGE